VWTRSLLALSLALAAAGCAEGRLADEFGGRGTDEDAGSTVKPPPPPGTNPDAAVIVPEPDADPGPVPDGGGAAGDAGCEAQTIDLLENGDFDSGRDAGWTETSVAGLRIIVEEGAPEFPDGLEVPAQSGAFLAYLAGYNDAVDEIHQSVEIPADATGLRLRGFGRIDTSETSQDTPFDNIFLEIQTPGGELIEEVARFSNLNATGGAYDDFERRPNGDYRGQTVRVQVRAATDASLRTHFFFDTLVLEVATCAGAAEAAARGL
jgi:hypothetical protein